jgi:TRAP transporter TAXI family solute receptor
VHAVIRCVACASALVAVSLLASLTAGAARAASGDTPLRIVTGSARGTAIDVARDVAVLVAPKARVDLVVQGSAGSVENVRRLSRERGVELALVQADVVQAYVDLAAAGDAAAAELVRPLRVVMPLFREEIHVVVRADSPLRFVDEIAGARINLGERGSGSALTAASLYRLVFDAALPEHNATHFADEEALVRLVTDRSVDVVVLVGGQPLRLVEDMKPEARALVRLLRFGEGHASRERVTARYAVTTLRRSSYPNLLDRDIEALAVATFLFTTDDATLPPEARDALPRLALAMCRHAGRLKGHGHPKWREVEFRAAELPLGWRYHAPSQRALASCAAEGAVPAPRT